MTKPEIKTTPVIIRIGQYEVTIVEWYETKSAKRGKDSTGAVYQFKESQEVKHEI